MNPRQPHHWRIYTADSEDDSEVEETEIEIDDRNLIAGEKFGYGFITTLPPSITSVSDIPYQMIIRYRLETNLQ